MTPAAMRIQMMRLLNWLRNTSSELVGVTSLSSFGPLLASRCCFLRRKPVRGGSQPDQYFLSRLAVPGCALRLCGDGQCRGHAVTPLFAGPDLMLDDPPWIVRIRRLSATRAATNAFAWQSRLASRTKECAFCVTFRSRFLPFP